MEHSCHKCGSTVEDGVPFCKQCGAPQIRVVGFEGGLTATERAGDSSGSLTAPPLPEAAHPETAAQPAPPPFAGSPRLPERLSMLQPRIARVGVQWTRALPGAALAGVFALLALVIPYAVFGPAYMMGGALAVLLYRRSLGGVVPAPGAGAKIGAASGGFAFLFSAVMAIATVVYRPSEVRQAMLDNLSQMVGRGYDPKNVEQVQKLIMTPDGLMSFLMFVLFVMLMVMVAGSSIGGALYAAWVRRRPPL
ncbi:MAG TPA: zinc ribbon domain-containing protein [Terriglobales bacterium]|nr:zinc ribbon domain-containing protein [Terriglobales bacterium]